MSDVPPIGTHDLGPGALEASARRVAADGAGRVLLVTGKRSFSSSGAEAQLARLHDGREVRRWSDVSPNTDSTELAVGLAIMAEFQPDVIVGVGGGSVMDMAKLLCAFEAGLTHAELLDRIRAGDHRGEPASRLVLAPTTSGSGSEATHFAVVYIGPDKFSIAGPALRAQHVALDPAFAVSGSPHQRATSGMDAICQAIESRWASAATRRSRRYAELALALLVPAIQGFVDGDASRSPAMQLGSHLAGRAIDVSKTTAAHALSYGITKRYGVDHGNAAALTLSTFIERHADLDPGLLQGSIDPTEHAEAMRVILSRLGADDGPQAAARFRSLLDAIGLPSRLGQVDPQAAVGAADLAGSVNAQRLGNNPAVFDADDLRDIVVASI